MDDPAIVCGIGTIDDLPFMFIGHQKGRNTKENIYRNFGMPQPNGYRKALRFMRHADKFGFPIVTFVDTPGAYAGKAAEELGQVCGYWLLVLSVVHTLCMRWEHALFFHLRVLPAINISIAVGSSKPCCVTLCHAG